MKRITLNLLAAITFCFFSFQSIVSQNVIGVVNDGFLALLDPIDGSVIDSEFIELDGGTPKALIQVGEEIWITYQIGDKIERYDLEGNLLNTISGGIDNIRGLGIVNNSEVWVTNSGTQNGAPGSAIVKFDFDGNNLGFFMTTPESDSPFDVIDNGNGEVYISYSTSDNIERRDYDGNFIANIVETGVVNFIQQIVIEEPGVILAAVFSIISGGNQNGLYRFSETDGSIIDFWNEGNLRGVSKLENGNILWSSGAGVHILDPTTNVSTQILSGTSHYFGRLALDGCTPPSTPTGDASQTLPEGSTLADIIVTPSNVTWFATEADALSGTNPLPLNTVVEDGETYYAVNIVDGCLSEPFAVTVTISLGIIDFDGSRLIYYPNPTNDLLNLKHSKSISEIRIVNLLGQTVLQKQVNNTEITIDLSKLPEAVYLVKVVSEGETKTIRILKK